MSLKLTPDAARKSERASIRRSSAQNRYAAELSMDPCFLFLSVKK